MLSCSLNTVVLPAIGAPHDFGAKFCPFLAVFDRWIVGSRPPQCGPRNVRAGKVFAHPARALRGRLVDVNVIKLELPGLGILAGTLSGLCQAAPPLGCFPNCEDELLIGVNLSGRSTAQQRRQELQLRDGDVQAAFEAAPHPDRIAASGEIA